MTIPKFVSKHSQIFRTADPFDSFLEYLESLNLNDWDELLATLLEQDDNSLVRSIIAPPPGIEALTYLARLLGQANPQASRLSSVALAAIVRRRLASKRSKSREGFLARSLSFASSLEGSGHLSVLEDIAFDRAQALPIRLKAAYALSDLSPEKLNPEGLSTERVRALAPAVLAAARGKNSEWLNFIIHLDFDLDPQSAISVEYPLGAALRDYEQLKGIRGIRELIGLVPPSSWLNEFLDNLLEVDTDLRHLRKFRVDRSELEKESGEERMMRRVKELKEGTRRARRDIWKDVPVSPIHLEDVLGIGLNIPPLKSLPQFMGAIQGEFS